MKHNGTYPHVCVHGAVSPNGGPIPPHDCKKCRDPMGQYQLGLNARIGHDRATPDKWTQDLRRVYGAIAQEGAGESSTVELVV